MKAETKVKAGAVAGGATGVVVWALMSFVPLFHTGVPQPVVVIIPVVLAWLGHVIAAYAAPHTPRPAVAAVPPQRTPGGPV